MQVARRGGNLPGRDHTDHRDPVPVRRAYVFRAYPTRPQEGRAVKVLRDHCDLYNAALEERREAWHMRKASITYGMQSAQLRDIREADPGGQGMHSFTAQQQTLRRLSDVFAAFFDRAANAESYGGKKPGYPGSSRTPGSSRSGSSTAMGLSGSRLTATAGRAPHSRRSAR